MVRYNPSDPNYIRADEYTIIEKRSGKRFYRCSGCEKLVSWREFDQNKGYCADCRDGKNEAYYRSLH